jgi:hypothetical protein
MRAFREICMLVTVRIRHSSSESRPLLPDFPCWRPEGPDRNSDVPDEVDMSQRFDRALFRAVAVARVHPHVQR